MFCVTLALASPTDAISFVLVDRYANEAPDAPDVDPADPQAWHGGDLTGVLSHIDDLRGGLWLSPIWTTRTEPVGEWGAFHGYWTADPYTIDPRFGTEEQLVELSERLRSNHRELWLDLVLNHVGYETPLVTEHPDWFHHNGDVKDWNDPVQAVTHDVHGLPDLDQSNPEVYAHLRDAALHWVRTVHPTGFRIDAVRHLPTGFLKRLRRDLHQEDPELQFLGEIFEGDPAKLAARQRTDELDRVFDFPLHYALVDAVCGRTPARLAEVLSQDRTYDDASSLVTFLDNHDVPRIRSACRGDLDAVARALAVLAAMRGSPSLTWGTDAGLQGLEEPENRADMDFANRPLRGLIDDLLTLRTEHDALGRHAPTEILELSPDHVVIARGGEERAALVLTSTRPHRFDSALLGSDCTLHVLTGVEGYREVPELVVPKHAVGLALCTGAMELTLAARLAGVAHRVPVQLRAPSRIVGVGVLGAWDPEQGLDPVDGAVRLEARVGEVLTYKVVRREGEGWAWPEGRNRTHLVVDAPEERRSLRRVRALRRARDLPEVLQSLQQRYEVVWLSPEGLREPYPPAWMMLLALASAHERRGGTVAWEHETVIEGRRVRALFQPVHERFLVRISPVEPGL